MQNEVQATRRENRQQQVSQALQSAGSLLKAERERQGLSQAEISEMTRMRIAVIEAIEKEAWGSLPPQVFLRGLIRSYAKVLGISQEAVIDLYGKNVPPESPGLIPRQEPSGNRRRSAWLLLLLVILGVAVYGMWSFSPFSQVREGSRDPKKSDLEPAAPPPQAVAAIPRPVPAAEEPPKPEPAPVLIEAQEAAPNPREAVSLVRDQTGEDGWLSLTGIVKERTWLRIRIDGKEEKEYLLQPGSRPQWRGKESFYMLIGNAGGIDFDLNGKKVGSPGKQGQVIRLTLPKDAAPRERAN